MSMCFSSVLDPIKFYKLPQIIIYDEHFLKSFLISSSASPPHLISEYGCLQMSESNYKHQENVC